jgi:Icc-related predicted phosphoesterase
VHGEARRTRALGHGGALRLGVTADARGDAARAAQAAAALGSQHVDGVLALGDLGEDVDSVTRVLEALGKAGAPVLALAGEAEPEGVFHEAVKRAQAGGVEVIDLVDVRLVDVGDAVIVSAPGYRYSRHGCHYDPADLEGLRVFVGRVRKPLVLAAHAPPRGDGRDALDRGFGDANVGDPALRGLVDALAPAATLFAHVDEAGGRTRGGWLNVGDGAALVDLEGGRATMRVLP